MHRRGGRQAARIDSFDGESIETGTVGILRRFPIPSLAGSQCGRTGCHLCGQSRIGIERAGGYRFHTKHHPGGSARIHVGGVGRRQQRTISDSVSSVFGGAGQGVDSSQRRRLVDVGDGDGQRLIRSVARRVGSPHRDDIGIVTRRVARIGRVFVIGRRLERQSRSGDGELSLIRPADNGIGHRTIVGRCQRYRCRGVFSDAGRGRGSEGWSRRVDDDAVGGIGADVARRVHGVNFVGAVRQTGCADAGIGIGCGHCGFRCRSAGDQRFQ